MIIGNFKPLNGNFVGVIQTLTFKIEAVFEPIDRRNDKSPDYRITTGDTEIGVAWKETSAQQKAYLSVQLDDPALPTAIKCALVKTEHGYSLVWDRSRRRA